MIENNTNDDRSTAGNTNSSRVATSALDETTTIKKNMKVDGKHRRKGEGKGDENQGGGGGRGGTKEFACGHERA